MCDVHYGFGWPDGQKPKAKKEFFFFFAELPNTLYTNHLVGRMSNAGEDGDAKRKVKKISARARAQDTRKLAVFH